MNQQAKYLGQKSFCLKVPIRTHRHTHSLPSAPSSH